MLSHFISVNEGTSSQTESKQSVFFCHLKMTRSVEEADAFIKQMKKTYRGYTNASAYIVGDSGEFQRARDNGEPSGTAGLPILEALKTHQVIHATAVVTRKWGGTLLGANRLKMFYGGAVDKAIAELGLAEWRLEQEIHLTADYHFNGLLQKELEAAEWITVKDQLFTEKVTFTCYVDISRVDEFMEETANWLNGTGEYVKGQQTFVPRPLEV